MRYYKIIEPWVQKDGSIVHVETILSEDEIIDGYFPYWKEKMIEAGKEELISEEKCLEDWITVNYAEEVEGRYDY